MRMSRLRARSGLTSVSKTPNLSGFKAELLLFGFYDSDCGKATDGWKICKNFIKPFMQTTYGMYDWFVISFGTSLARAIIRNVNSEKWSATLFSGWIAVSLSENAGTGKIEMK